MGWQMLAVAIVIALAAVYVGRRFWLVWTGTSTGGCHCGTDTCAKTAAPPPASGTLPDKR